MRKLRFVLGACKIVTGLAAAVILAFGPTCQAQSALVLANSPPQTYGLPNDLQVVLECDLPADATYYSIQHWLDWPPSPANRSAGRPDVSYYVSPSLGLGTVIVDDPELDEPLMGRAMDASGPPTPGGGGSDDGTNGVSGGPFSSNMSVKTQYENEATPDWVFLNCSKIYGAEKYASCTGSRGE